MEPLETHLDTSSSDFAANAERMQGLVDELNERLAAARQGGGPKYLARHQEQGKMPPRERIAALLDPDTPFLELSPLAANGMYDDEAPAAGIITGIGRIQQRECLIIANDATVKGGTYFPMTVKKHLRAQEVALQNNLPCIYLVDSGGAFLPLQAEVFPDREHFGRIFYNQAVMSAREIPQISAVMGSCTAGGAYVPAMSDEAVIVKGTGTIFLGGPPLVKAATGEEVTAEELGGADVHTRISGVADHFAEDDDDAIAIVRNIVENLPLEKREPATRIEPEEPLLRSEGDLRRHSERHAQAVRRARSDRAHRRRLEVPGVQGALRARRSSPASRASSATRSASSPTTACSSPSRRSRPRTSSSCATSAASRWSSCRTSPASWSASSTSAAASPRTARRWSTPWPTRRVPKFTVIIGGSFGAGNYGMCGRAYSPRFLWMWPNARICVMGGEQAAGVLTTVKRDQLARDGKELSAEEERAIADPVLAKYETEGSPYYSTARLWDDGVIDPADTRIYLGLGLSIAYNAKIEEPRFGVFRM